MAKPRSASNHLSHVAPSGSVQMVDVTGKAKTAREALASGLLVITEAHREALSALPKGDALTVAQIAGIQGGKRCSDLIPLCHPVSLNKLDVAISICEQGLRIEALAKTEAETGVEMEAYTAVVVAGITLIDMLKSAGPDLTLTNVQLLRKTGGKTDWHRESPS